MLRDESDMTGMPGKAVYLKRMICIITGGAVSAAAVNIFFYPENFLSGGLSGIALILDYTLGFPAALAIVLLNIPIFIIGYFKLDIHFIVASLAGMFSYTFFINLMRPLEGCLYIPDEMLSAVVGGVINGMGLGLIFRNRASVGGTDILSKIAKRYWSVNLGTTMFLFNILIVAVGAFFFPPYKAMYSLISMFITSVVLDQVVRGFERRLTVFIISEKAEIIAAYIMDELKHGATLLEGEGAYRKRKKKIVYTVIPSMRLAKLKDAIEATDSTAFVSVQDSTEIMGNWKTHSMGRIRRIYKKDE